MVSSGMKVPVEIEETGGLVVSAKKSAVVIDLDSDTNTLSIKESYSNKLKHPFRVCLASFQPKKASYALVNVELRNSEDQTRKKLVMVMWAPDGGKIKVKMTAASGLRALRSKFAKCNAYVEIHDKTPSKNINDLLSKLLATGEGCTSIEGVPVCLNEKREYVFADGKDHDDSDFDEED